MRIKTKELAKIFDPNVQDKTIILKGEDNEVKATIFNKYFVYLENIKLMEYGKI
jgi:hypothetical protein